MGKASVKNIRLLGVFWGGGDKGVDEEVRHILSIAAYLHCESTHAHIRPYALITPLRAEGVQVPTDSARGSVSGEPQGRFREG